MNTVLLVHNTGQFIWEKSENLYVKGYLNDRNGKFYENKNLLDYFQGIETFTDFEERVKFANGCFSVVFQSESSFYAASDIIRSFPLFYGKINGEWVVSDDPEQILKLQNQPKFNEIAGHEFLASGFVTGSETLLTGLNQVQAGECLQFKDIEIKRKFYSSYRTSNPSHEEYKELSKICIKLINDTFSRLVQGLANRTVIVPLSGGFDSRLIAVMLKKLEYKNVICITYGRPDNPEIKISKKVAEILGFKWICVDYSSELIEDFLNNQEFKNYFPFASKYVSMFYLQEYFAVRYLKEKKLIPDDSIFIPGHTGDFIGGRHLGKYSNLLDSESIDAIAERIYTYFYCYLKKGRHKEEMLNRIEKSLEEKFSGERDLAYSIQEDWELKEKLAKFIANSVTTYTFFGYDFRLPYWDHELVNFFKTLPLHMKINKFLYDDILRNEYFEPYGVNFEEELQASEKELKRQILKDKIKRKLPQFLLRMFHSRQDNFFYYEITKELVNDMARKGEKIRVFNNSYNSLIIQWYLKEIQRGKGK